MAFDATISNRAVNKFFAGELILFVGVAGKADIISFGHQQLG